jgi:hypothetical protein
MESTRTYILPFKVPKESNLTFKIILCGQLGHIYTDDVSFLELIKHTYVTSNESDKIFYEAFRKTLNYHHDQPDYMNWLAFKQSVTKFPFEIPHWLIGSFVAVARIMIVDIPSNILGIQNYLQKYFMSQGIMYEILRRALNNLYDNDVISPMLMIKNEKK